MIVNPRGISKWSGVEAYCRLHGIAPSEVAAVGDGLNDLEMLRQAGISIGVRGGSDEVITIADYLIEPPDLGGWQGIIGIVKELR